MTIRDFLYLDIDLVRSFAAQVFEGVTEGFVDEASESRSTAKVPRKVRGEDLLPAELATASLRSENKVLHDHLFSLLEQKLATGIVSLAGVDEADLPSMLREAFLVKITGEADIEDYGDYIRA